MKSRCNFILKTDDTGDERTKMSKKGWRGSPDWQQQEKGALAPLAGRDKGNYEGYWNPESGVTQQK